MTQLVYRLYGLALVGTHNVTIQKVTFENAPMDGVILDNTLSSEEPHTHTQKINIQKCNFIACHRNGISVIDADDLTIADNHFKDIWGDPGSPVDVEPDHPWQHASRITIRDNEAFRCYRGIGLVLQTGDPTSENFRTESITGNHIRGTLYQWGILVLMQQAGATISGNTIEEPAGEGILVSGSSQVQVTNNIIVDPGRCHTKGNCRKEASGVGIRLIDDGAHSDRGNTVTGNTIQDDQKVPTLLYGIDFSSAGVGNTIERNVVSGFDPEHGDVVHVNGNAEANKISGNNRGNIHATRP